MHQFAFPLQTTTSAGYVPRRCKPRRCNALLSGLVLEREPELVGLERLLGSEAVAAVKTLAADRVVVRPGERLWASPVSFAA